MSAHVLLNLLNELREREKMRDSIYHMIIKITLKSNFCRKKRYVRNVITFSENL